MPSSVLATFPPLHRVAKDRIRVERAYARMQAARTHPYLENERAIPRELLESRRFAGRIQIDARGNAIFPHFDGEGLCGFEIKNDGYTSYATGGEKGLWTSHIEDGDRRIVFCESAIDAVSHAALFPDAITRHASIGGKPTMKQKELIRSTAAVMPASCTVVAAMDADAAGEGMAEMIQTAVRLTGRSDLQFERHTPEGQKDWNDVLRARPKPPLPSRQEEPSIG